MEYLFPRHEEKLPREIGVIIWDVNGTITDKDRPDREVGIEILKTAQQGIAHIFITGRDRFWLENFFLDWLENLTVEEKIEKEDAFSNLYLYPELGLLSLDPISRRPEIFSEVKSHQFVVSPTLRERIATFFLRTEDLEKVPPGEEMVPPRKYIVKDANGVEYYYPLLHDDLPPTIKLPEFIWSNTKELIGTAEVIRDASNRLILPSSKIIQAGKILETFLAYSGLENAISVSPVSTAINFTPIIDGMALDKDWSAGRALITLAEKIGKDPKEIAKRTIAIGDGKADFLFSCPKGKGIEGEEIGFVFVGEQFIEELERNVIWQAISPHRGPKVTLEALRIIKERFSPLI